MNAQLILCEPNDRWIVPLRSMASSSPRIHVVRDLSACLLELVVAPASFLFVDMAADNVEAIYLLICDLNRRFPNARIGVLTQRDLMLHQSNLRELGACDVACTAAGVQQMVQLARNHLARTSPKRTGFRYSVWERLAVSTS